MHQHAGAHRGLGLAEVHALGDEPFRELPGVDAGWRGGRILWICRRQAQLEDWDAQQPAKLGGQPWLSNLVPSGNQ